MTNVKKRLNLDLRDKSDNHGILKRQPKISFDNMKAEYEKVNSDSFDKEGILIIKPNYVG